MWYVIWTDKGIRKNHNEDGALYKEAATGYGRLVLAAVCDGLGGLAHGEKASAITIKELSAWFEEELPKLLEEGLSDDALKKSLNGLVVSADEKVGEEGECGTTLVAVIACNGNYICVNIGDSRAYLLSEDGIEQLTHDQTKVQRMVDRGELTKEEAEKHPDRSILLQCIGAGGDVKPVYITGEYSKGDTFLLCSDGFWHKLTEEEMLRLFGKWADTKEKMEMAAEKAVEVNMQRHETDNITVVVVRM